jgi:hypothetical protein
VVATEGYHNYRHQIFCRKLRHSSQKNFKILCELTLAQFTFFGAIGNTPQGKVRGGTTEVFAEDGRSFICTWCNVS